MRLWDLPVFFTSMFQDTIYLTRLSAKNAEIETNSSLQVKKDWSKY
jgi:hypothetical protein